MHRSMLDGVTMLGVEGDTQAPITNHRQLFANNLCSSVQFHWVHEPQLRAGHTPNSRLMAKNQLNINFGELFQFIFMCLGIFKPYLSFVHILCFLILCFHGFYFLCVCLSVFFSCFFLFFCSFLPAFFFSKERQRENAWSWMGGDVERI